MNQVSINQVVDVTRIGFRKDLETYPCRIEFNGESHQFIDAGWRYIIRHGNNISRILMMTDGRAQYRLRHNDDEGHWTLLSITV